MPEVSIKKQPSEKKERSPRKSRKAKKAAKKLTEEEKEQIKTQLQADLAHEQQLNASIKMMSGQAPATQIDVPDHKAIQELKALGSPPAQVVSVIRMVLTLLYGSEKQESSWSECQKALNNPRALAQTMQQVSGFDISGKDPYLIQLLIQMIDAARMTEDSIKAKSFAASKLFRWIAQIVQSQSVALEEKITLLEVRERIAENQALMDAVA